MAIPKGITEADVKQAIHDYHAGVPHPYGPSTRYDLVLRGGRRYPPKAIVGLAARRLNGGVPLDPDSQFGGGEGRSAANRVLRDLGYSVVGKGEAIPGPPKQPTGRRDWDATEISVIVDAYFDLLHRDLAGEQFVKREVVRGLETRLRRRTRGSIEYKFENISAVLEEDGLAFLRGYVPQHNYQQALKVAVLAELDGGERERLEATLATPPASHLKSEAWTIWSHHRSRAGQVRHGADIRTAREAGAEPRVMRPTRLLATRVRRGSSRSRSDP
jgi:hypothetical protein